MVARGRCGVSAESLRDHRYRGAEDGVDAENDEAWPVSIES
jgi:hypothetical protein